jgi:Uma2 family endonuclease
MNSVILKGKLASNFNDDEFFQLCAGNPELRIERNRNLEIVIMSSVTALSGLWNMEIARQLANWSAEQKTGFAFDSSTGFSLPDRSILSPDASWVSREKWMSLPDDDKDKFAPICPEFVIEIKSKSDSIDDLKKKMKIWISNGAELGWLIDLKENIVYLYRANGFEEVLTNPSKLFGEGKVAGFILDLSPIL